MMITNSDGVYTVSADGYTLRADAACISPVLGGVEVAALDVRTPVCVTENGEERTDLSDEVTSFELLGSTDSEAQFVWRGNSSLWTKLYRLDCYEDRFEYSVTVCGRGAVDSVNYFGADFSQELRGSEYDFADFYYPVIPLDGTGGYIFKTVNEHRPFSYLSVPPMFCYSFRTEEVDGRLALGLVAGAGEHNFTQFDYRRSDYRWGSRFWLSTDQCGHTAVDGEWTAPKIVGWAVKDDAGALVKYRDYYFDHGICGRGSDAPRPRFWYGPIACGWLEQLSVNYAKDSGLIWSSRQDVYTEYLRLLEEKGLHPKILIIDDKWQSAYGVPRPAEERWPDLRGFIDRARSERDIHTLMWYKMWDAEGVPEEYCVFDGREKRYVADPSNPGYQAILKENIRRIISDGEGCANADGLKIDFAFWQPVGREACSYSGKYGVELFAEYVRLIHDYMKEIKPYAVLNASPCHPLFAQYVDQARLHDYDYRLRRSVEEFSERAALWRCALPNALIDTDGCGYNTRRDTVRYLTRNREIGIPCIYAVSPTPYLTLSDDDWAAIAASWREYEKGLEG